MDKLTVTPSKIRCGGNVLDFRYENDFIKSKSSFTRSSETINGVERTVFSMIGARDSSLILSVYSDDHDNVLLGDGSVWYPQVASESFFITALLSDDTGSPLESSITLTRALPPSHIEVYDTDSNGECEISFGLSDELCEYFVQAFYSGDNYSTPVIDSSYSNVVHVKTGAVIELEAYKSSSVVRNVEYSEKFDLKCTVYDNDNVPLPAGVNVRFWNGNTNFHSANTNSNGEITVSNVYFRTLGAHDVYATVGDDESNHININVNTPRFVITPVVSTAFVGQRVNYTIRFLDSQNNPISGEPINVVTDADALGNIVYTDSNGSVSGSLYGSSVSNRYVQAIANNTVFSSRCNIQFIEPVPDSIRVTADSVTYQGFVEPVTAKVTATNSIGSVPVSGVNVTFEDTVVGVTLITDKTNLGYGESAILTAYCYDSYGHAIANSPVGLYRDSSLVSVSNTDNNGVVVFGYESQNSYSTGQFNVMVDGLTSNSVLITEDYEKLRKPFKIIFDDRNGVNQNRPSSVTVKLYEDDLVIDSISVSASENWEGEFEVPDFEDAVYNIKVDNVSYYTGSVQENNSTTYVILLETVETVNSSVKVIWNDNNNGYGVRPESVTGQLKRNNTVISEYPLNDNNDWMVSSVNTRYYNKSLASYDWNVDAPSHYVMTDKSVSDGLVTITLTYNERA